MSEPKFTPGPWEVDAEDFREEDGSVSITGNLECVDGDVTWYSMARVVVMRNDDDYDSGRANAALIASSPDLYAACKAQHEAIDRLFARLVKLDPTFFPSKSGGTVGGSSARKLCTGKGGKGVSNHEIIVSVLRKHLITRKIAEKIADEIIQAQKGKEGKSNETRD